MVNPLLASLCGMLASSRPDHPLAAATVLAHLAPREPAAVKAIAGALGTAPRPLKLALLEALDRIGSPLAAGEVLPLLEGTDEEVRGKAIQALVRMGPGAVKPITRRLVDAPAAVRRSLLSVLSRVRTGDARAALMGLLSSGHPEAAREAALALAGGAGGLGRAELAALRSGVESLLRAAPDKAPAGSLSAALSVMAAVGQPAAAAQLLRLTGPRYPEAVRRDALLAVSGVLKGTPMPPRILAGILPLIQNGPSPALRSAALEVLGPSRLPAGAAGTMQALLDHADPAVRRFAARKLGEPGMGGAKSSRRLVALLRGGDPSLRDAASEALGGLPEAAPALLEELIACAEIHRAWTVAHILRRHVERLRRPGVRRLFDKAVPALAADDRIWEPLLHVVRHHDPRLLYEWLMEASEKFRKARKYAEAEACLIPLSRGDHFDSEARYALALAGVRAARAKGGARGADGVEHFRHLVRDPAFPLVDRLKKERARIETEDLYHLGFLLAEGTPEEKDVGAELLKIVAARSGATKLGRSARSKLRVEGLDP
ncbi:MAG TPA: HEAT repeat domain-containing protein [Candidatus Polarisedimenticolia bacterium]|nr:HEAT repeat domain-containing protein [Candidatus Polarisedimenticolia bacterium]